MNFENLYPLGPTEWSLFALILMISYGVHFAFAGYFALASFQLAPRYRVVAWMSGVVMVSAGLSLMREHDALMQAFRWTGEIWEPMLPGTGMFSNAFRYGNWLITVPILLVQLPLAMALPNAELYRRAVRLILAGEAMIVTGLIYQFNEVTAPDAALVWGLVSTAFFLWLLWEIRGVTSSARDRLPPALRGWAGGLFWFMASVWWLYPVASAMPFIWSDASGVIWRQGLFTVADVTSKLIYGLILSRFLLRLGASEGYRPSAEALGLEPTPAADEVRAIR